MAKAYRKGMALVTLAALLLTGILVAGCSPGSLQKEREREVVVSTYALAEAARAVAGDRVKIRTVIPPGMDAHLFSPTPKDVAELSNADMFVYSGAGFEQWAKGLQGNLSRQTIIVDMSRHVTLLPIDADEAHVHSHGECNHDHSEGGEMHDPHYWLDIDNMIAVTQTLKRELSRLYPEDADTFHRNAAAYIAKLRELKTAYASALAECKHRYLVSNHNAFGYLAKANSLEHISVIGLSSDEQPGAHAVAQIVSLVREKGIGTIFFEELIDDNVAHTIARETGAQAIALHPLENISRDEVQSSQTYLSVMRSNLVKLKDAMECR